VVRAAAFPEDQDFVVGVDVAFFKDAFLRSLPDVDVGEQVGLAGGW